ncbi:carboxyl-terminal processing protease [Chromohalobacter marismortui]|uniref:Carboxyl-terminal processing protease n=1 Tax=Chromohalobacter marismortui TaxID=42055 RepID=A0A4R7NNE5_9GAMM|nr:MULTISPECIES: S41 family peptidase [Chromohalobacter]MCI0509959.1 S41 family peptidase [Chromohalobacter sp.]MCI0593109.1 S41 family peptidase [Chromohalobacter sp.]TDU22142.1 carboxyl-terminal processing protease [Chromohalobacter marismortui]
MTASQSRSPRLTVRHVLALSMALMIGAFTLPSPASAQQSTQQSSQPPADNDALPVEDVQTFAEVFERIKRAYVDEVDDTTLMRNAMRGMLGELDPHSTYLDKEAFQALRETTEGEFSGVGIEVGMQDGQLTIISPLDGTPAARAGLQAQDRILLINDTPTESLSLQEAVDMMRGKAGEELQLTILRDGEDTPRKVTLTRETIQTESVKHKMLAPGYGYLRISQFQSRTGEQARDAIAALREESKGKLSGLVLDLRNNPGGVLGSAVDVADLFLDNGLIVYTEGRLPDSDMRFTASSQTIAPDVPMVVLINGGSASAAEIVAGALQDQQRAVLMGTESFGKGSVQQVLPLPNGDGLKLTTALYYTPDGRSIQAQGIAPDVDVVRGRLEVAEGNGFDIRESDLENHLRNINGEADPEPQGASLAESDYQLGEALNLLRALNVLPRAQGGN